LNSEPIDLNELDALPTLDELVASGKAKIELFKGKDISSRFQMSMRALNGEFSKGKSPESDTEADSDGSITAALIKFPSEMVVTVVGRVESNALFLADVQRCVSDLSQGDITVLTKDRSAGKHAHFVQRSSESINYLRLFQQGNS
jgi:putative lipoic acid-binding regulatory protein